MATVAYVIEVEDNETIYVLYDDELLIETKDMSEALRTIEKHHNKPALSETLGKLFTL